MGTFNGESTEFAMGVDSFKWCYKVLQFAVFYSAAVSFELINMVMYSVLCSAVLPSAFLYHTVLSIVLKCFPIFYNVLHCDAVIFSVLQYCAVI